MSLQMISLKNEFLNIDTKWNLFAEKNLATFNLFENSIKIYRHESSKLQGIKYFYLADIVKGFSNLKPNWDSYNADSISNDSIELALETLNHLNSQGLLSNGFSVNVFPMRDGGIQFEFDGENICAELEINQNGDSTFILYADDGNIIGKGQLFELSELSTLLEEAQYAL